MTTTASLAHDNAAAATFLRGIDRRALVLAEAQCGDSGRARAALDATSAAFCAEAVDWPLRQWPSRFWQLLLAQPALHSAAIPHDEGALAQLGSGPRAALLLRLVAGLDPAHGAEVLQISPEAYRHALHGALRALQARGFDEEQVRVQLGRMQMGVRQLPHATRQAPVLSFLARREVDQASAPHRRLRRLLVGLLALLLAALAASFVWQPRFLRGAPTPARSVADAPALPTNATLLSDPDFDLLLDPGGERMAGNLGLLSWYAEQSATTPAAHPGLPEPAPMPADRADWSAVAPGLRVLLASWRRDWNALDPDIRRQLLANAGHWQALDANGRNAFLQRSAAWQRLPPLVRAQRRARYEAWHALPADAQSQVHAAAIRFAALSPEQQEALRAQFAGLDADAQHAWLLGPSTGSWIGQARTLFAYVPDDQRDASLRMLETLSPPARAVLFERAGKLPDAQREQLRRQLLDTDPAQRAAVLDRLKPR